MIYKNIILVLILLTFFLCQAAAGFEPSQALTIDSIGILQGTISCEYERKLTSSLSVSLQGQYSSFQDESNIDILARTLALGLKSYLFGSPLNGFYLGAFGVGALLDIDHPDVTNVTALGIAISAGVKGSISSSQRVCYDVAYSLGLPILTRIYTPNEQEDETIAFGDPSYGINVGFGYRW